jgi:hypothetical protein
MKTNSDIVWEPFFAFAPPTLLIKAIADMGAASAKVTRVFKNITCSEQ